MDLFPLKKLPFGVPQEVGSPQPFCSIHHPEFKGFDRVQICLHLAKVGRPKNLVDLFPLKKLPYGVPHEFGSPYLFCSICRAEFNVADRLQIDLQLAKLWGLKIWWICSPSKNSILECPTKSAPHTLSPFWRY